MPRYTSPHTIKFGIGVMSRHIKKTAQGNYDITRPGDTLGSGTCVEAGILLDVSLPHEIGAHQRDERPMRITWVILSVRREMP